MINCPLQFLSRDEDLSKSSIDQSFARVQAGYTGNSVLILEDEPVPMLLHLYNIF